MSVDNPEDPRQQAAAEFNAQMATNREENETLGPDPEKTLARTELDDLMSDVIYPESPVGPQLAIEGFGPEQKQAVRSKIESLLETDPKAALRTVNEVRKAVVDHDQHMKGVRYDGYDRELEQAGRPPETDAERKQRLTEQLATKINGILNK